MLSKTYVICWDGSLDNCLEIDKQLLSSDLDYLVYNVSSEKTERKNWINAPDIRYYGHFHNALKDFCNTNYPVFIFNAGDPFYEDLIGYTKKIETIMNNDKDIYALAPNIENDIFSGSGSFVCESEIYRGFNLSTQTNGIYFAFSRELAIFIKDYLDWGVEKGQLEFPKMHSGWGVDIVSCALAFYKNKKVYRDSNITMSHPNTTSTNQWEAPKEMHTVLDTFKDFCTEKGLDSSKIQAIYDLIFKKVKDRINYIPLVKDVYVNLEGELIV
jgi:hypothetical protein